MSSGAGGVGGGGDGGSGGGRAPLVHRLWRAVAGRGGRDARRSWLVAAAATAVLLAVAALFDPRLVVVAADDGGRRAALTLSLSPRLSRGWGGRPKTDLARAPVHRGGGRHGTAGDNDNAAGSLSEAPRPRLLALPPGAGAAGPWVFALVADMDRQSRRYDRPASAGSPSSKRWVSFLKRGLLTRLPNDAPLLEGGGGGGEEGGVPGVATLPVDAAGKVGGGEKRVGRRRLAAQVGPADPSAPPAAAVGVDPGTAFGSRAASGVGRSAGRVRVGAAASARRDNNTGGSGGMVGVSPPPVRPPAYAITWFDSGPGSLLWSRVNEDGRGMELSELAMYHGRLFAPDDRTGVLFEVLSPRGGLPHPHGGPTPGRAPSVTRRTVLADGDGESTTAFKSEWMSVKRGELIIGGHGREVTAPTDGTAVRSTGPLWVKVLSKDMTVSHADWTRPYNAMRDAAGAPFPGYLLHEAGRWSDVRGHWLFLPRRHSVSPYDPVAVERSGWNGAVTADEAFTRVEVTRLGGVPHVGDGDDERGFSSFAFVPGSGDRHVLAIRTVEREGGGEAGGAEGAGEVESYISVLNTAEEAAGAALLPETRIGPIKYEGVEFL